MTVIEDTEKLISRFGWPDYLVFVAMLSVSAIIGIYYAWYVQASFGETKKRQ